MGSFLNAVELECSHWGLFSPLENPLGASASLPGSGIFTKAFLCVHIVASWSFCERN